MGKVFPKAPVRIERAKVHVQSNRITIRKAFDA